MFLYVVADVRHVSLSDLIKRVWEHKSNVIPSSFTAQHNVHIPVYYEVHSTYIPIANKEAWERIASLQTASNTSDGSDDEAEDSARKYRKVLDAGRDSSLGKQDKGQEKEQDGTLKPD